MKNKKTVLNQIESVRVQVLFLKKQLEQKTITEKDATSTLNRIEALIDNIEDLVDLEDENY